MNLVNQFLISMPNLNGDIFARSVVLICEHDSSGAVGIIVNKPCGIDLKTLFRRINLPLPRADLLDHEVHLGGPVQLERGFVLHEKIIPEEKFCSQSITNIQPTSIYTASVAISDNFELTTSFDILESIAMNGGPNSIFFALGCASWFSGQLEAEINDNVWLTTPFNEELIFNTPAADRYARALKLIGITENQLISASGHA